MTYKLTEIRTLMSEYDFQMTKSLGQNFLIDKNTIDKILDSVNVAQNDKILEIGTGMGALTTGLAERGADVTTVEIDKRLIPVLSKSFENHDNVRVVNDDFMKIYPEVLRDMGVNMEISDSDFGIEEYKIFGNLPYYITTPIIMKVLESPVLPENMVFMMQKEVGERLLAEPGNKTYGSITVAVNFYCDVERVMNVSKEVFFPKPKIDSTVLKFTPKSKRNINVKNQGLLFDIIKAGFGKRRKTLKNALASMGKIDKEAMEKAFVISGIDPTRRAETLSLEDFISLANSISSSRGEY